jgi:dihydrofolate reductase
MYAEQSPMAIPHITMTLAMSLDGYIARRDGSFDWIVGDGAHRADTPHRWDFAAFLAGVDIVVMGRNSYVQGFHHEYAEKQVLVLTTTPQPAHDHVVFVTPAQVLAYLHAQALQGRPNVYLFGGSRVIAHFVDADAIDDYYVGIVPVILGAGIPLFGQHVTTTQLTLHQTFVDDGIVVLHYRRRETHDDHTA